MRKFQTLLAVSAFACAPAALAQETAIIVDLSGISADLAALLGIEMVDVPTTIDLSPGTAAIVCGVDAGSLTDSCVAITSSDELTALLEDELDDDEDSNNSAAAFAPGQQDGPARDFAPGQQDGPATDYAPGQVKKDDGETGSDLDDDNGSDSGNQGNNGGGSPSDDAPGQNK